MLDYKMITSRFSVAGAIESGDMAVFARMGFRTIISNLPDAEVTNGFTSDLARAQAIGCGLSYIHMPANGAIVSDPAVITQFSEVLAQADQPVLAHCKTGTRSAILFGLVSAREIRPAILLKQLDEVGFNLDFLEEEFEEQWQIGVGAEIAAAA